MRCAASVAYIFAIAASRVTRRRRDPASRRRGRRAARAASISVAMSASFACVSWNSASGLPNDCAAARRAPIASSSARRAKPSAAAPTVERKMSSVAMRELEAVAGLAEQRAAGTRQSVEGAACASGCGAIIAIRSAIARPGVSASTTKARDALARPAPRRCARRRRSGRRCRRWRSRSSRRRARSRRRRAARSCASPRRRSRPRARRARRRRSPARRRPSADSAAFSASRAEQRDRARCPGPAWRRRNRRGPRCRASVSRTRQSDAHVELLERPP